MANNEDINERLVESLREDSIDAFNLIYRIYAPKLLGYISKATNSKEDAEEIVHDIFMGLWKNRNSIKHDTNLSSLLFSMAYKRRIDYFRHILKAPIYEDYTQFQNDLKAEDNCKMEYDDFVKIFNKALGSLPMRLQSVLIMSRLRGLSNEEIAIKLNVSLKTVQNNLSQGLKILRVQLDNMMRYNN